MSQTFDRATDWILRRRWLSGLVLLILTTIAIGGYLSPEQVVSWLKQQVGYENVVDPAERPDELDARIESRPDVETLRLSGFDVILVARSGSFFSPQGAAAIRAVADRQGHFVVANGGTVFLDEIGDMPLEMQAKLLRVLQEGEVRPVGSNKTQKVDVRVVAATNKDLEAGCREGTFREDLFFRLNVVTIVLPPLREREGDVEHLVRFLLAGLETELGRELTVTPEALAALSRYSWPGNVRELENELKRAAVLSDGAIGRDALSAQIAQGS